MARLEDLQSMKDFRLRENPMDDHTERPDPSSYPYSSLRVVPFKHTFRLLILIPAADKNSPIQCTLAQDLIENGSSYEALSYVWSAVPGKTEIQVNNQPFLATKNLEAALRALRSPKTARILWVDAICINQNDPLEKQTQVQMMAQIFSKATNVLVWLGNETNAAARAFEFLEWISPMLHYHHYTRAAAEPQRDQTTASEGSENMSLTNPGFDESTVGQIFDWMSRRQLDHHLECVATVLRNPYWSRIWVLQEVVLARSATVTCGSLSMEWSQFSFCVQMTCFFCQATFSRSMWSLNGLSILAKGFSFFQAGREGLIVCNLEAEDETRTFHTHSLVPKSVSRMLLYMKYLRKAWAERHPLKMSTLLHATVGYKSTDVRDKIYALLSMADMSEFATRILPDYTSSYPEVCTQLAVKFLLSRMDLAVLEDLEDPIARNKREVPPRHIHLPSWVPDYGNLSRFLSLDCQNWKDDANFKLHEYSFGNEKNAPDRDEPQHRVFNASAYRSSRLPYSFSFDLNIFTLSGIEFDTVKERSRLFQDGSIESKRSCLRNWQSLVSAMLNHEYPRDQRGATYKEAYWRTAFCNIWPDMTFGSFCELPSIVDEYDIHIPPTSGEEEQRLIDLVCTWSRQPAAQLNYRTIFLTRSGLLGLGPASMDPGDILAVLMGGRVPIVLRQSNDCFQHGKTQSGLYYRVIGESYVHGVMQGEIVQEQEAGTFKLEEFHLV